MAAQHVSKETGQKAILQEWSHLQANRHECRCFYSSVCGACKMAIYCSPQCAKMGWKQVHKEACSSFKDQGKMITLYKSVIKQFPWTDIGYDIHGVFRELGVLAPFGLLGMSRQKVGYWAMYETQGSEATAEDEVVDAPWNELTEAKGWKLPAEQIPSLTLENSDRCPTFPPSFEDTWQSYYQWRQLPMESPAALLLHWPMSVYACLKELGFVQPGDRGDSDTRRKLTIFYVGARHEICYLPVFGELALNFPNTDLELVMFGQNAAHSVRRAKACGIKAAQSSRPCVFEYKSPASWGSGSIRIYLDSDPAYYRPSRNPSEHPDAIIALNAGMGSYISWQHVTLLSSEFDIPFCTTDYNGSCLLAFQQCLEGLQQVLTSTLPSPKDPMDARTQIIFKNVVREVGVQDVEKVSAALQRKRPCKFNEFMQPGLRPSPETFLPGSPNSCLQVITPRRGGV
ncbi:hypothetical protein B0H10DRAFT_2071639 [Mycena sp. CBHHK59/15]|nr:hypothetical protein B0H10DRAFT_2071639 [Mycena sp. CBHHK59/15]